MLMSARPLLEGEPTSHKVLRTHPHRRCASAAHPTVLPAFMKGSIGMLFRLHFRSKASATEKLIQKTPEKK